MEITDDTLLIVAKDLYLQLNLNKLKPDEARKAGRIKASRVEVATADAKSFAQFTLNLRDLLKSESESEPQCPED